MQPRAEGFAHQTLIVLPEAVVRDAAEKPLLRGLLPVAIGYFPRAEGHLVERSEALADTILLLVVAGRGWVRTGGGRTIPVGPGQLAVIPPGESHAYGADERDPWTIHWAHLRGADGVELCRLLPGAPGAGVVDLPAEAVRAEGFGAATERLAEDYTLPNLLSAAAQLRAWLSETVRLTSGRPLPNRTDAVGRTLAWMQTNLAERPRLEDLAERAGMSATHFSAQFRRRTGYSPVDYFLRLKVQQACRLLDTTPGRVEEIARAVGYEDAFYFSRLFRRVMGRSPRDYRRAIKG